MPLAPNRTDSRELDQLRIRFEARGKAHGSPLALGRFAGQNGIEISDFGSHSNRWRGLFLKGFKEGSGHV